MMNGDFFDYINMLEESEEYEDREFPSGEEVSLTPLQEEAVQSAALATGVISTSPSPLVFKDPSEIAPFVYALYKKKVPRRKTEKIVKGATLNFDTSNLDIPAIVAALVQDIYSGSAYKGEEMEVRISQKELDYIKTFVQQHPSPIVKAPHIIEHLLLSYLANSRYDDHESGWVTYNKKRIFTEAGLQKLSEKEKTEVINILVHNEALKLKVVGKKNPKLCYFLSWRDGTMIEADKSVLEIKMTPDYSSKNFLSQIEKSV